MRRATAGYAGVSGARVVERREAQGQGARQPAYVACRAAARAGNDVVERSARRADRGSQAADILAAVAADWRRSRRSRESARPGDGHCVAAARRDDRAHESRRSRSNSRRSAVLSRPAPRPRRARLPSASAAEREGARQSSRSLPTSCAIPRSRKRSCRSTSRGSCRSCSSSARSPISLAQEEFMRAVYGTHPGSYVVPPENVLRA